MKSRPRSEIHGVGGHFPAFGNWGRPFDASGAPPATAPMDAVMAFAAFTANQAVSAQIDFAHSVARILQGQAAIIAKAGERTFAPGPIRAAVTGAADLQADCARHLAHAAQAMGRKYGHLAFAFPAAALIR